MSFLASFHKQTFLRFLIVFFVFVLYFLYVAYEFGLQSGLTVTFLTWSFFVLCTPVADAGFVLDFPIRVVTKIKMWISEVFVWLLAIGLNVYFYFFNPVVYNKTIILQLFYKILNNPVPYWSIIILSGIGTFLSVYFADELIDVIYHHKRKFYHSHKFKYLAIAFISIFLLIFFAYYEVLRALNISF